MPTINHFDYFTDIEQAFIRRRGKHLMIGPLDWSLIDSWQTREIPLRIVLQAIDEVFVSFEQRGEDKTAVRSLKYCADAVEKRFADWSRANVGKPAVDAGKTETDEEFAEGIIKKHIAHSLAALQTFDPGLPESLAEGFEIIRNELKTLQKAGNSEGELDRLDGEIDGLILGNKEILLDKKINNAIDAKLSEYGIDAKGSAAERVVCEAVRDAYRIPRLSLFRL